MAFPLNTIANHHHIHPGVTKHVTRHFLSQLSWRCSWFPGHHQDRSLTDDGWPGHNQRLRASIWWLQPWPWVCQDLSHQQSVQCHSARPERMRSNNTCPQLCSDLGCWWPTMTARGRDWVWSMSGSLQSIDPSQRGRLGLTLDIIYCALHHWLYSCPD